MLKKSNKKRSENWPLGFSMWRSWSPCQEPVQMNIKQEKNGMQEKVTINDSQEVSFEESWAV